MGRLHPQVSPKTDPADWSNSKYGNANRSMPLANSGNKIDKIAYLKCNEQIRGAPDGYPRKDLADTGHAQYESPNYPYQSKGSGDSYDFQLSKTPTQSSPSRKAPRMSEPGFPTYEMDYPLVGPGGSNTSPIRDNQQRFGHYETDVFKKQKEPVNGFAASFKNSLRRSEFRATDFIKGKELGSGKFGTVEVVKYGCE